jgi:T5orf172 domain
MTQGYLYVLSNPSIPGLLKIGRTDREPDLRARELRTTGVPQPFVLEHYVLVKDSFSAEKQAHSLLQTKGARMSPDREFFSVDLRQAIEVLDLISGPSNETDFSCFHKLAELAKATLPLNFKASTFEEAEVVAHRLASLGRRGYPAAVREAAEIFEHAHPHGPKFKDLWREYLSLARAHALWTPLASSNGRIVRADVGRAAAKYIELCARHRWLIDDDFTFISAFLVEGDQFQYDGYLQELPRCSLSDQVFAKARDL